MQQSWRQDHNKLTFIICEPASMEGVPPAGRSSISLGEFDGSEQMVGDINLFLSEDDENESQNDTKRPLELIGEVEIMIARKDLQGKGMGKAALEVFLDYISTHERAICAEYSKVLGSERGRLAAEKLIDMASVDAGSPTSCKLKYLRVKVNANNTRSVRLFETFKFVKSSEKPNYFGELELRKLPEQGANWASKAGGASRNGQVSVFLNYEKQGEQTSL